MTLHIFLIFGLIFFIYALISRRLQTSVLTPPLLFMLAGLALHKVIGAQSGINFSEGGLHVLAEFTLILVLAADASQISLKKLRQMTAIPLRLLLIALPLIMICGTIMGKFVFVDIGWYQAALIAAVLAPTDAALGASILSNARIPLNVRQGLNVESGLNDGIALPAVLFFACFLNLTHQTGDQNWLIFLALQLSLGPLVGIFIGWCGGHLIAVCAARGWITQEFQGVAAVALAVLAFAVAELVHGNGFIAAFIAGLTYGNLRVSYSTFLHEFTETESQILAQTTFFIFGAVILPEALQHITWPVIVYALMSLTLVRMLPVWISMWGLGLKWPVVSFIGWFGPRGLASLLFALLILEDLNMAQADFIQTVVAVTVCFSVVLHGLSAAPLGNLLGAWSERRLPAQDRMDISTEH